jgi:hypothetical protein
MGIKDISEKGAINLNFITSRRKITLILNKGRQFDIQRTVHRDIFL